MTLLTACALGIWVYLLLGHGYFWRGGPLLTPGRPVAAPAVTVVVPARDEAETVSACLHSLLAQDYAGELRVVLVDDGSTDGTGEIARRIDDARLAVVAGAACPEGWSGKLWALEQGVAQTATPWLLLTDADIVHEPAHLAALMAKAEQGRRDLVSGMVELHCASLMEKLLVPAFVFFFTMLYPFSWANESGGRTAAAAGGTILVRRAALVESGGLAAMRDALIDDVTLARRIKRRSHAWIGHTRLARSLRRYPSAGDIWRMVARTAYVQLRFSPLLLLGTIFGMLLVFVMPPIGVALGPERARLAGALAWAAMTAAYLPTLRRLDLPWLLAPALPIVAIFYTFATIGSAIDHYSGRGVVWKQRTYS